MKVALPPVDSVEVVTLIKVIGSVGAGTEDDPCRKVAFYYTEDGELVAVGVREYLRQEGYREPYKGREEALG